MAGAEEGEGRSGGEEREPNPRGRALLVLGAGGRGSRAAIEGHRVATPPIVGRGRRRGRRRVAREARDSEEKKGKEGSIWESNPRRMDG